MTLSEPCPETPGPDPYAPATFRCDLQRGGGDAASITLGGELDLDTASQLQDRLDEALTGARLVVVDLRQLTFMDSTGLTVIVTAHNRAQRSERRLVLVRGPAQVDRLLELTGLSDRLEVTDVAPIPAPASWGTGT